jgi:hypothetical protein
MYLAPPINLHLPVQHQSPIVVCHWMGFTMIWVHVHTTYHHGRNVIQLKEGVGWVWEYVTLCSRMMPTGLFVVHIQLDILLLSWVKEPTIEPLMHLARPINLRPLVHHQSPTVLSHWMGLTLIWVHLHTTYHHGRNVIQLKEGVG